MTNDDVMPFRVQHKVAENEIKIPASINFHSIPISAAYLFRMRWSDI